MSLYKGPYFYFSPEVLGTFDIDIKWESLDATDLGFADVGVANFDAALDGPSSATRSGNTLTASFYGVPIEAYKYRVYNENASTHVMTEETQPSSTAYASLNVIPIPTSPLTAPTNLAATVQTSAGITLTWTIGKGSHYDLYRAESTRAGFWGTFTKVNTYNIANSTTTYTDTTVVKNVNYCYILHALDVNGSHLVSNPAWAVAFDGYNATGLIYDSLISRIASTLVAIDPLWKEAVRVVDDKEPSSATLDKRYSVLVGESTPVAGPLRAYDTSKNFKINLCRTVSQASQNDNDLRTKIKGELSDLMERLFIDLVSSKLALPSVVVRVDRPSINDPQYIAEQFAVILSADIKVTYRINLG